MKKQISRKSYGRTSMPEERRGARLLRTCLLSVALVAMVMREGLLMLDSHRGRLSTLSGQDFSSLPLQAILTGGNLTDSDEFPAKLDSKERLIALVHVGKAGGMVSALIDILAVFSEKSCNSTTLTSQT